MVARHFDVLPHTKLHNEYGPTEATVWSSVYDIEPTQSGPVPIGRPIWNTKVHLLGQHGELVPPGTVGEICAVLERVFGKYRPPEVL